MNKKMCLLLCLMIMAVALLGGCGADKPDLITKEKFPEFSEKDLLGNDVSNDIFSNYDATIINFWSNGCGTCIAEMPELEEMYQSYQGQHINLIGVGADSGESSENLATAQKIVSEKGVTYQNISPNPDNSFYKDFVSQITGFPTTYVVDSDGNMIGSPIVGNVKEQSDKLNEKLQSAKK